MTLEKIKEKSGILTWSEENIIEAPESPGISILRTSPINGAVVHIESSGNLKESLLKVLKENIFPDTKFFDWYTTETKEEAELIEKELVMKYSTL